MVPDQIKRDAKWVLRTPGLMQIEPHIDAIDWLSTLDCNLHSLHTPSESGHRLGRYYEELITSILRTSPYISDIKQNIQVRENFKTLGEFDILGRHKDGYDFHLECAIKFFLCTGDGSSLSHFEGPNRRDRLDLKWHKMKTQQITLSNLPASQRMLNTLGYQITRRLLLIQGYLFYPYNSLLCPISPEINSAHNRGWWIRTSCLSQLPDCSGYHLFRKPHWLAISQPEAVQGLFARNQNELNALLAAHTGPVMVARLDRTESGWIERDRGFIVPDSW